VKADNQIEDAVVQAKKDFAQQIAVASGVRQRGVYETQSGSVVRSTQAAPQSVHTASSFTRSVCSIIPEWT